MPRLVSKEDAFLDLYKKLSADWIIINGDPVAITAMRSLPANKREKLDHIMEHEHFELFNSGSLGVFWYTRPLIDASKEGGP